MLRTKFFTITSAIVLIALALGACGPASTPTPITVTQIVAGTPQTIIVTATPGPEGATALPEGSVQLNGAGATFPQPVYVEWTYAYQYVDPSVVINYQAIGSGGGKKAIVDNTVDFAGSDSLLKQEEYDAGKDLQMYPVLAGAIVPIYNIEGVTTTITLDRPTLAGMYLGTIKTWNDPAIVALNPDVKDLLPNKPITTVHRSDGSGTTEAFTKALSLFSDDWKNGPGAGSAIEWPTDKSGTGVGGKGNAGVAAAVQNTPNSIGYVELSFAIANKILYPMMVNKAGKTVKAEGKSLESAMNDYADKFSDKLTNDIEDGAGEGTWPVSAYTYLILHTTSMTDCTKATKLLEFWHWALTDPAAAKRANELGYSVLPEGVRTQVLDKFAEVTCNGQPVVTAN